MKARICTAICLALLLAFGVTTIAASPAGAPSAASAAKQSLDNAAGVARQVRHRQVLDVDRRERCSSAPAFSARCRGSSV